MFLQKEALRFLSYRHKKTGQVMQTPIPSLLIRIFLKLCRKAKRSQKLRSSLCPVGSILGYGLLLYSVRYITARSCSERHIYDADAERKAQKMQCFWPPFPHLSAPALSNRLPNTVINRSFLLQRSWLLSSPSP